jgi:Phosphodiester glycosidase
MGEGPRPWPDRDNRVHVAVGVEWMLSHENGRWLSLALEGGFGFQEARRRAAGVCGGRITPRARDAPAAEAERVGRHRGRAESMMTWRLAALVGTSLLLPVAGHAGWSTLAPGLELGVLPLDLPGSTAEATILRADPEHWELVVLASDQLGEPPQDVRSWCESHGLVAGTNAGMFATDHRTHVGFLQNEAYVGGAANEYQSVVVFGPKTGKDPKFAIYDLDVPGVTLRDLAKRFSGVVQNLRLIKHPGENRWSQQSNRWSEAALGQDQRGRILFIFCRQGLSMYDFNQGLLQLDVDIVAAQHLEGGPEAQLYVDGEALETELVGSYETNFEPDDSNVEAWPIPNVLGLRARERGGDR